MTGDAEFPTEGLSLRGAPRNSSAVWAIWLLGIVVLISDLVVGVQWLIRGRPMSPLYVFAFVVLALCTVMVAFAAALAALDVRKQKYRLSAEGLAIPWRTRRLDLKLQWADIASIRRHYDREAGGSTMGVEVFVVEPDRLFRTRWAWPGTQARRAVERQQEHGTPIYLDLTDISGGTVRFFAAARWYAGRAGRAELVLV